jgi:hypothetical protein
VGLSHDGGNNEYGKTTQSGHNRRRTGEWAEKFCSDIDCLKTLLRGVEQMKCSVKVKRNAPVLSSGSLVV